MHFSVSSAVFASCICNPENRLLAMVEWSENSFKPKSGLSMHICVPSLSHHFTDLMDSSRTPDRRADLSSTQRNFLHAIVDREEDEKMDCLTFYDF